MEPLKVGICGLGTVAQGVLKVLAGNRERITRHAGRAIQVVAVASRRAKPEVDLGDAEFSTDVRRLAASDDIDVLVELIGGEDTALELVETALARGTSVVTGNKAIIALHGNELLPLASAHQAHLGFEAAVAGSIPIIANLTHSLVADEHQWLAGIINGTSNFILTAMCERGESFADALREAQKLGYAEADPSFDVEGIDAAHKLTILTALGFDTGFNFNDIYTEGISRLTVEDIEYSSQLGYRIKHLGLARRRADGIEARVHPVLVPKNHLLANIGDAMNAVLVRSQSAGDTLYSGAGAGQLPTASAVIADLVDVARGTARLPAPRADVLTSILPIEAITSAYYLRIPSLDRPGVFARVATILSEHEISIEAAIQREQARVSGTLSVTDAGGSWVPIVILTHAIRESVMNNALEAVQALPDVVGDI
ncbi:MAG: homoserine dehydrogenase, partial [Gammaproteobacteria bacterium]|nr:homoserine dehydrogenase [Gammaproteobacteria bacterium]